MKNSITIKLPLRISLGAIKRGGKAGKEKLYTMSMNNYAISHRFTNHKAKQISKEIIAEQVKGIKPIRGGYTTHLTIYFANKTKRDPKNFSALIYKFGLDALQELDLIDEDDFYHDLAGQEEYELIDGKYSYAVLEIKKV